MDYGHSTQSGNSNSGTFFTAGAGTQSMNDNNFEKENNLDLGNTTWKNSSPQVDHNIRGIGANVLTNHESSQMSSTPPEASPYQKSSAKPEIGQIVNLEMPPSVPKDTETQDADSFSLRELFSGDKLTDKGLSFINEEENKFRQGSESISDFYDEITKIREASQSLGGGE